MDSEGVQKAQGDSLQTSRWKQQLKWTVRLLGPYSSGAEREVLPSTVE